MALWRRLSGAVAKARTPLRMLLEQSERGGMSSRSHMPVALIFTEVLFK